MVLLQLCGAPMKGWAKQPKKRLHLPAFRKRRSCSAFVCVCVFCWSRSVSSSVRWILCWWSTWSTRLCTPSTRPTTTSRCATQRRTARLQQAPALSTWWGCVPWSTVVLIWKKKKDPNYFSTSCPSSAFHCRLVKCWLVGIERCLVRLQFLFFVYTCVCVCFRVGGFFIFFFTGMCLFGRPSLGKSAVTQQSQSVYRLIHVCFSLSLSLTRSILQQLLVGLVFPNLLEAGERQILQHSVFFENSSNNHLRLTRSCVFPD